MQTMSTVKKSIITAVCIALCYVLPLLFHGIQGAGQIFCPMHIPVFLCGLVCGWQFGLLCGLAGPALSSALCGMPPVISGGFQDFFMLSDSFSMVELPVPEEWTGHNLEELDLRKKYSINVIAVKDGEDIRVTVNPKTLLRAEEVLILIGENKELAKLMKNRK